MSRADRELEALLYLPSDELVRATIEGDDADWSEAASYVPSELLVAQVLAAPPPVGAEFRFPPWLTVAKPAPRRGLRRAAAVVLAAFGLSPSSLAASTVAHIVVLIVAGPLFIGSAQGPWGALRTRAAPPHAERITYVDPRRARPQPPVRPPRVVRTSPATSAAPADTVRAVDSTVIWAHMADVRSAARAEIQLREGITPEGEDARRVERLIQLLRSEPWLRVRVVGIGPRRERAGEPGMREAESLKRLLVSAGIAEERVEILRPERPLSACPEREPNCAGGQSRVLVLPTERP